MQPIYQVEYSYYQHNDGRGNNGQHSQTLTRPLDQCLEIARLIQSVIDGKATGDQEADVFQRFHPYTGSFSWVKVYEVTRREVPHTV